jgi:undecaprenyl-diphosphatase
MNLIYGVALGIVQGLTEFLPVSSSAHLVIVQHLLPGFEQPGVLFDVILHLGTTAAVLFYFRYEIMRLTMKEIKYLLVGSIPAGVVGIVFQTALEDLFLSTFLVGITLFVTAALNFFTDRASATRERMNYLDAIVMGIGQAIAIIPGISRSGATIFAGTSMGLDRQKAAQYSFLLSVPAILGATVLQLISHGGEDNLPVGLYILGFMTALVTGFISIMLTFRFLTEKKFTYFAIYCVVLGFIALLL